MSITEKECKDLSLLFSEKVLLDKEYLLRAGERAKYVGLIISGGVREFFLNENGDEFNKSFSFQNEMTGSYFDLLNQKESIANIQAIMDTKLIIAPFDKVHFFFNYNYHWQRLARVIAENLFLKKARREYEFVALSAEERYKKFLKEYPLIGKKIPQYHIASYLGVTSVALSRIKKRIEIKNNIAKTLQEFVIKLNLGPSILIGNSVGGFSASSLAVTNPEKVKALVLVDSGGFIEIDTKTKLFCKFKGAEFWTGVLWNLFPSYYLKVRNDYVNGILENIKNNKSKNSISVNATIWRSFVSPDHDIREGAKNILAPTLLVWGKNDPVIPIEIGKSAEKIIPNSKLMVLETGHIPFAEDPEGFLKIVVPFIEKISLNNK